MPTDRTYPFIFGHKIQYIISIESNESIVVCVTLGFIGNIFLKHRKIVKIATKKVIFLHEGQFYLSWYVNKQKGIFGVQETHVWSSRNQCTLYESLFGGACGHHSLIFLWKRGRHKHYDPWRHLSHHDNRFFVHSLHFIDINNVWFQKDGATCHTSHATNDLLHQTLDGHLISWNDDVKKLLFGIVRLLSVRRY